MGEIFRKVAEVTPVSYSAQTELATSHTPEPRSAPAADGTNTTVQARISTEARPSQMEQGTVTATVLLEMSIESVAGATEYFEFVTNFEQSVADALNISQARVTVTDIRAGSVYVDFA